jgi:hypothetical protein
VNLSVAEVAKLVPELYREVEDAQYLEDALLQLVQVACAPLQKSAFMLLFTHFMSKSQLVVHINKNVSLLDEPGAVQVLHTLTLGLSLPLTLTLTLTIDLREGKDHGVKWTVVPLCIEVGARGAINEQPWNWKCKHLGFSKSLKRRLTQGVQDAAVACSYYIFLCRFPRTWEPQALADTLERSEC